MAAVGVNFIDVYQREGVYPNQTPFVLGMEGAGTVRDTGERVAWGQRLGTGASVAAIPADELAKMRAELGQGTSPSAPQLDKGDGTA